MTHLTKKRFQSLIRQASFEAVEELCLDPAFVDSALFQVFLERSVVVADEIFAKATDDGKKRVVIDESFPESAMVTRLRDMQIRILQTLMSPDEELVA